MNDKAVMNNNIADQNGMISVATLDEVIQPRRVLPVGSRQKHGSSTNEAPAEPHRHHREKTKHRRKTEKLPKTAIKIVNEGKKIASIEEKAPKPCHHRKKQVAEKGQLVASFE